MSWIAVSLSSGRRPPRASAMCASWATACAVAVLSPVSMTEVTPSCLRWATAATEVDLIVSATANKPRTPVSSARRVTVRPCVSWAINSASSWASDWLRSRMRRWLPRTMALPSTMPSTPRPSKAANRSTSSAAPSIPAAMALDTGWSERAARLLAQRCTRASSACPHALDATSFGLPSVRVPVLSTATALMRRASSR
ncbi:hypothetical protein Y695_00903 [Hydrogenophaga sp. T4]|nr:hypothetical protein Y695_00903 [Hydrogenophaga sp. T4]